MGRRLGSSFSNLMEENFLRDKPLRAIREIFQSSQPRVWGAALDAQHGSSYDLLVAILPASDCMWILSSTEGGKSEAKLSLIWKLLEILAAKGSSFAILEMSPRVLGSKGRGGFCLLLKSLLNLGYGAEWVVVKSSNYGSAQKRRKLYLFDFKADRAFALSGASFFKKVFPMKKGSLRKGKASKLLSGKGHPLVLLGGEQAVETFSPKCFESGEMRLLPEGGAIRTQKPNFLIGGDCAVCHPRVLGDVLEKGVPEELFFKPDEIEKLRRAKQANQAGSGVQIALPFPDSLTSPARERVLSEGEINRNTIVVEDPENGRLRRLSLIESERLSGLPDNYTAGMSDKARRKACAISPDLFVLTRIAQALVQVFKDELFSSGKEEKALPSSQTPCPVGKGAKCPASSIGGLQAWC